MTFADYLLELFYLIDSELEAMDLSGRQLRRRGPRPRLHDSEVLTIELAGEFLGIDTDQGIWQHFRYHHGREFPLLRVTDRSRFVRQAADLWRVKQLLHQRITALLPGEQGPEEQWPMWLFDSFPLRVCRFKRAAHHRLFQPWAAYGRDPTGEQLFYGFRVHLRCTPRGFCAAATIAAANVADWPMLLELLPVEGGVGIGDRNYWNPREQQSLQERGLELHAPFRKRSSDPTPRRAKLLSRLRQIIEPVIGQLAGRFHAQRTWARDLWHLCSRLWRKLLSHATAVLLNWRSGHPPLQLALLIDP